MLAEKTLYDKLGEFSKELGFETMGVTKAVDLYQETAHLRQWLNKYGNNKLDYLSRNIDKRQSPELLFSGTKSVLVFLQNYYTKLKQPENSPIFSRYAYGKDYHIVVKNKLFKVIDFLKKNIPESNNRCFVDTAPVFEKAWANRAALGWIGKNSLLITKKGSFFFIGVIFTNIIFDNYASAVKDRCGNCNLCVNACPTKAITDDRNIILDKCISFFTTEKHESLPNKDDFFAKKRLYGCDICQEICPWNKNSTATNEQDFLPKEQLVKYKTRDWLNIDEDTFNQIFQNSVVKRIGYEKFMQNLRKISLQK